MINDTYIDPKTVKMVDLVRDGKKVRFLYFRDNEFWYRHEDGFMFPVSLQEATTGRATFLAEDKAIYFMRWMKKYVEACKSEVEFGKNPGTGKVQVIKDGKVIGEQG